jgi:hypothetical protein
MKQNVAFVIYNYVTALIMILVMLFYNIGYWPFTENIVNKSYLPSNSAQKYTTVSALLLGQLFVCVFIMYILVMQHRTIDILFTNV